MNFDHKKWIEEKIKPFLKETVETILFVTIMIIVIKFFLGEPRWIPSSSMYPTLIEKDRVFVERVSGFYSSPKRGDILVFYPPSTNLKYGVWDVFSRLTGFFCKDIAYIKRVVGLPNETIEIKKERDTNSYGVYIDGKKIEEPYILSEEDYIECNSTMLCGPFKIPEGEYFMLGDNRGNSQDSRFWGTLPEDRIIGRAVTIFWPLNRLKIFKTQAY